MYTHHLMCQVQRGDSGFRCKGRVAEDRLGGLGIDVDVEFSPRGPVTETFSFAFEGAHGCVREATSNSAAHDGQSSDMVNNIRESVKQQCGVGKTT